MEALHLRQEVEERSWEDAVSLFQDVVQGRRDPGKDGASDYPHGIRILVGEQGKERGEAAETSCEKNEERKFLLWIDGHLVEDRQQFAIRALSAAGIWIE